MPTTRLLPPKSSRVPFSARSSSCRPRLGLLTYLFHAFGAVSTCLQAVLTCFPHRFCWVMPSEDQHGGRNSALIAFWIETRSFRPCHTKFMLILAKLKRLRAKLQLLKLFWASYDHSSGGGIGFLDGLGMENACSRGCGFHSLEVRGRSWVKQVPDLDSTST